MEEKLDFIGRLFRCEARPLIIAEVGANHNGDMGLCRRLIDAAVSCEADAVKFQSWTEESLLSRADKGNAAFLNEVRRYQLTPAQHFEIQSYCRSREITFLSTPFSTGEADLLEEMDVPLFKIASMDINHLPFLRHVARKKRPMIVSTGMATLEEIGRAVDLFRDEGNEQFVLLHCVSLYPPDFGIVNLRNMQMLSETFKVPSGYSDHTIGIGCSLAAIALGARLIEKHFTLDKTMDGWDHAVSADPGELAVIVKEGRNIARSLGQYQRTVSRAEMEKARFFRRSLVVNRAMKAGEVITVKDLDFKRPGTGIGPDQVDTIIGRKLVADIQADDVLLLSNLE